MSNSAIVFRNQVNTYVMFLVARVGSTYLTTLLDSHPKIKAMSEELRDLETDGAESQLRWASDYLSAPLIGRNQVLGFNAKLVHLCDPDGFGNLLQKRGTKIVHMQRQNKVKAVISRINGERLYDKTGMWGKFDKKVEMGAFEVDPVKFDEYLQHRENVDQELENYVSGLQLPLIGLHYEDLLKNEDQFLNSLFKFLGVDPMPVSGKTLKITSDDLRKVITNFDELKSSYIGTQYESMFDEVITP